MLYFLECCFVQLHHLVCANFMKQTFEKVHSLTKVRSAFRILSNICEGGFSRYPASNYMFKVSSKNTRTRCEICSKLTIKTPERRLWLRAGVYC